MLLCLLLSTTAVAAPPADRFAPAADSRFLRLLIDQSTSQIAVEDKRSGKVWTSNPAAGPDGRAIPSSDQRNALFFLTRTDGRRSRASLLDSAALSQQFSVTPTEGGASVDYRSGGIGLTMVYRLGDDYLDVRIPADGLIEGPNDLVTQIQPLPFFGAVPFDGTGYVLVPDGAGAILRFRPEQAGGRFHYESEVYGPATVSLDQPAPERLSAPVFGLATPDGAFVAIIADGGFDAGVTSTLANDVAGLNRVGAQLFVRRSAQYPRQRGQFVPRFEASPIRADRRIRYVFLSGRDADYVGMAQAYRQFLTTERAVPRLTGQPIPVNLRVFLGAERPSFPFPDMVSLTTFDEAIEIVRAFEERGVGPMTVTLVGWERGGYAGRWPERLPAAHELGGDAGLQRLAQYCREHGHRLVLEDQYFYGLDRGGGFSPRVDVARGANRLPIANSTESVYVLNAPFARQRFVASDLPRFAELGVGGELLRDIGTTAIVDLNDRYPLDRRGFVTTWRAILADVRAATGWAGVVGPNDYTLGAADYMAGMPLDRANHTFFEETVPFLPIAYHGLVDYSGPPGNLRGDATRDQLRQIEYGAEPTYELTYRPPRGLARTTYPGLIASDYRDWIEAAVDEYRLASGPLGATWRQLIVGHTEVAPDVFATTYEDGTQVIVNYGERPYDVGGGRVEPGRYLIAEGRS